MRNLNIVLLSTIVLAMSCCNRQDAVQKELDEAERLMDASPDSALVLLESIPASTVRGEKAEARYALLKSMAFDKKHIDTATFEVLQPAIDYYIEHGTPNDRLRTYYCQGRIYQNQGDDDSAMRSFMNACDLRQEATDTSLSAHALVAQGTLFLKQNRTEAFVSNNLEAAKLFESIGEDLLEIKSYTNALDGFIMQDNKSAADSLLSLCVSLVRKNPVGEVYLFSSFLSYTIEFCPSDEIKVFLDEYQALDLTADETVDFARGYSKIGEYDKAISFLSQVSPSRSTMDSLKYISVKIDVLDKQSKYEQAFALYKAYSVMLERYQQVLLSKDLLYSDKKHQLEMEKIIEIQRRDKIILGTLCGIFGLIMLVGWLYYRDYLSRTRRVLTERENENLKLEISQLERERDGLKELQKEQSELDQSIQEIIRKRLDLLNGLLAKEITNNDSYAEPYNKLVESVREDKQKFLDSTRLAITASHPKFVEYLVQHDLSADEINYLCLYAIGLRGKEVGEYIQSRRHYIISHEIRKKLGMDEHETNIGLYIRKLMEKHEK